MVSACSQGAFHAIVLTPTALSKETMNMSKLESIEGIGPVCAEKLSKIGIKTQEKLLAECAQPAGRKQVAEKCDISPKLILKWANRADLARVKGIGEEYADLLEVAGVDTVPELAQRNAENLHKKMEEVNSEKKLVRRTPAVSQVEKWVSEAKGLPRALHY